MRYFDIVNKTRDAFDGQFESAHSDAGIQVAVVLKLREHDLQRTAQVTVTKQSLVAKERR